MNEIALLRRQQAGRTYSGSRLPSLHGWSILQRQQAASPRLVGRPLDTRPAAA